ncbi:MAG: PIN domain-containing protein [Kiritimatiellia bacterium]|jgi:predicted nucleic acid-binding protein|nr:PIN domain-containing protein [Kiritimatiellia bacterium]MDP6848002.1 PIN domain-containing protein [Kiritimatiellia bacterium]
MILIDTSAWIDFLRRHGDPATKSRVAAYIELGDAAYCGPVEFELLTGARPREISDVKAALSFSTLLPFPQACWQHSAEIEKQLRSKGVTIPRDDIFVAAAALHHEVSLFTHDPHFTLMRDKGNIPLELA